jgi:hypothetical protein
VLQDQLLMIFFHKQAILRATKPIEVSETEKLTVIGQRGIWVNKVEVSAWRGDITITEYKIHEDSNPQVINKLLNTLFIEI